MIDFSIYSERIQEAAEAHDKAGQIGYFEDHVTRVFELTNNFFNDLIGITKDFVLISALLHDVVEDTAVSREQITEKFGRAIDYTVWCLTDEEGKNRKEKKLRTYHKIRGDDFSLAIKLCDRIANVEKCRLTGSKFRKMYVDEYYTFKCALWAPNDGMEDLWQRLDELHEQLEKAYN